ncbi:MAG: folylpolyglutamate synthase/dihydrofolate synthase family protein [Deltaproteobacteria bacterium]
MNKTDPYTYLASLNIDSMHFGLEAITALLLRLENPQNSYKTILIAGTNGKGSTAAMAASILHVAGYKVGLYTSPHLIDVRERIAVSGRKISKSEFSKVIEDVKSKLKQPVTYFEFLTAVAFHYFQRQQVDIAVLEVGLGGRLDATNVCMPIVSVITNIGLDHTAYLGSSLKTIAGEKAGIIKQGGICITAVKQKQVLEVLNSFCHKHRAKLYCLGRDIKIKKQKDGLLSYQGLKRNLKNLPLPLQGRYQYYNAALALATVELCCKNGFQIADDAISRGLASTHWDARLETLQNNPLFLLDGAHNPAGMRVLCQALKKDYSYRRLIFIFGALADKDYRKMLRIIELLSPKIILTQLKAGRAVPVKEMEIVLKKRCYPAIVTENVAKAIEQALAIAERQDLICAAGSLYLAGEVKQIFAQNVSCDMRLQTE